MQLSNDQRGQDGRDGKVSGSIEVVTLGPEQLMNGLGYGSARPFADLTTAVRFLKASACQEERAKSWIRDDHSVMTLEQAEQKLSKEAKRS